MRAFVHGMEVLLALSTSSTLAPTWARRWLTLSVMAGQLSLLGMVTSCIPATNPYDPDTDDAQQVASVVFGRVAYPTEGGEVRPPDGITVRVRPAASDDPDAILGEVVSSSATDGRFRFEDVRPGIVLVEASAPGYANGVVGPIEVFAGEERNLFTIRLEQAAANATVSGTVSTAASLSQAGVVVELVRQEDGACLFVEASTETDANGDFVFEAVRPGSYVAFAWTEGGTVALADVDDVVAEEDRELDASLVLNPISEAVQLTGVPDGVGTTRTPYVDVALSANFDATEMRFGQDPTFAPLYGGTGWLTYANAVQTEIIDGEGHKTIFFQMRNACISTPTYASRITYDATPPVFLQARLEGVDGVEQAVAPTIVIGDTRASVDVALTVQDLSGVTGVQFLSDGDLPDVTPFIDVGPTSENTATVLRVSAPLAAGEGRHSLRIRLRDRAGNETAVDDAVVFSIVRDLSPPTTPLASVEEMEVDASFAYVWLDTRSCGPEDARYVDYVCEANPPAAVTDVDDDGNALRTWVPRFQVRGGPDYTDFTPVAGPPFRIRLFDNIDTLVEIQAVDDAGNVSPGVARVRLRRAPSKLVFEAPSSKTLGYPPFFDDDYAGFPTEPEFSWRQPLVALSGNAIFSLRPKPAVESPTYYSYLISQPLADGPVALPAGHRLETVALRYAEGVRKLSFGIDDEEPYLFRAAGLSASSARLSWLEIPQTNRDYYQAGTVFQSTVDGNGRLPLQQADMNPNLTDEDGEPAFDFGSYRTCEREGAVSCQRARKAWLGLQNAPTSAASNADSAVFAGASGLAVELTGTPDQTLTIEGPAFVATNLSTDDGLDGEYYAEAAFRDAEVDGAYFLTDTGYEESDQTWSFDSTVVSSWDWHAPQDIRDGMDAAFSARVASTLQHTFILFIPQGATLTLPMMTPDNLGDVGATNAKTMVREMAVPPEGYNNAEAAAIGTAPGFDLDGLLPSGMVLRIADYGGDLTTARAPSSSQEGLSIAHFAGKEFVSVQNTAVESIREPHLPQGQTRTRIVEANALGLDEIAPPGATLPEALADSCMTILRVDEPTPVQQVVLEGQGPWLDRAYVSLWEREGDSTFGTFQQTGLVDLGTDPYTDEGPDFGTLQDRCRHYKKELLQVENTSGSVPAAHFEENTYDVVYQPAAAQTFQAVDETVLAGDDFFLVTALPVTANTQYRFHSRGDTGDIDIHVVFSTTSDIADAEILCRPYAWGSDEDCPYGTSPDDPDPGYLSIAEDGWLWMYGNAYTTATATFDAEVLTPPSVPPRQLSSVIVPADEQARITLTNITNGAQRLLVARGREPSPTDFDCSDFTSFFVHDATCVLSPQASETEVFIAVVEEVTNEDLSYTVEYFGVSEALTQPLLTFDQSNEAGLHFEIEGTLTGGGTLFVADEENVDDYRDLSGSYNYCRLDGSSALGDDCVCEVNGDSFFCEGWQRDDDEPLVFGLLGTEDGGATGSFEVRTYATGCDEIISEPLQTVLQPGSIYALAVTNYYGYGLHNDSDGEALVTGVATRTVVENRGGSVHYLGEGVEPVFSADWSEVLIPTTQSQSTCAVRLLTPESPEVRGLRLTEDGDVLLAQTASTSSLVSISQPGTANAVRTEEPLPGMADVLDLQMGEQALYLVDDASNRDDLSFWVHEHPDETLPLCRAKRVNDDGLFVAQAMALGERYAVLGGQATSGAEIRIYRFMPRDVDSPVNEDGCAFVEAKLVRRKQVDSVPVALATDDNDLFYWLQDGSEEGRLWHDSLRNAVPLYVSGRELVESFDVRNGATLLSHRAINAPTARLSHLAGEGHVSRNIPVVGNWLHLKLLNDDVFAGLVVDDAGYGSVRMQSLSTGQDVLVSGVEDAFIGRPEGADQEPLLWAQTPALVADGELLAVSGFSADLVPTIAVLRFDPADPLSTTEVALAPEVLESSIENLYLTGGLMVVKLSNGTMLAYHLDEMGGMSRLALPDEHLHPLAREWQLVGAVDGKLAFVQNPGNFFAALPRTRTRMVLVDAGAQLSLSVDDPGGDAGVLDAGAMDAGAMDGGLSDAGLVDSGPIDGGVEHYQPPATASDLAPVPGGLTVRWVPSALFQHAFGVMERDVNGELLLFDTSATPAALWRLDNDGETFVVDGALRPLNDGAESLSHMAHPKVDGERIVVIRGSQNGRQLLELSPLQ